MQKMNYYPIELLPKSCYQYKQKSSGMLMYFLGNFDSQEQAQEYVDANLGCAGLGDYTAPFAGCNASVELLKNGSFYLLAVSIELGASLN